MKLPPANTKPLDCAAQSNRLGRAAGRLLETQLGGEDVFFLLKTRTKVDVGNWFFKRQVRICMLAREMLLFAPGKRPYAERIPFDRLGGSEYNHVTGEVMLLPADDALVERLRVPPLAGLNVLAHIFRGEIAR